MKSPHNRHLHSILSKILTAFFFWGILCGSSWVAFAKKKPPKWKTKRTTYASLFVARSPFPSSAETARKLKYKAWKHRQREIRWSPGSSLQIYFMLFVDKHRRLGTNKLYMVLFKPGSKENYFGSHILNTRSKMRRLTSPLTFSGSYLKRGQRYELRAIRIRGRRGRRYKQTIARTFFRLK